MKWTTVTIFLVISLTNAEDVQEKRGVLRRTTRQALNSMSTSFLQQTERNIINNCNKHKTLSYTDEQDLKETFDTMKRCVQKSPIFTVSKQDFLDKIEECSRDSIKKVKNCLASNQQYFPDFILSLSKSMVHFLYDDKPLFTDYKVTSCISTLGRYSILLEYIECLKTTSAKTHDDQNIPISQEEFCNRYVPATECFPGTLRKHCDNNDRVDKFLTDFLGATTQPCKSDYQTYVGLSNKIDA
ncbi:uncharacterized protein LOC130895870 [Diorhabda carinulata]|uniref:uncharacterized protein LOC130895870 n=1 Tax=Diorhabda carinulata TaxID=1163345 RepID=UPI0025A1480F|nr:uncharacterized protein LOC130895870 [Diorhabda carinulata]